MVSLSERSQVRPSTNSQPRSAHDSILTPARSEEHRQRSAAVLGLNLSIRVNLYPRLFLSTRRHSILSVALVKGFYLFIYFNNPGLPKQSELNVYTLAVFTGF